MFLAEYLPRLEQISIKIDFDQPISDINGAGIRNNCLVVQTLQNPYSIPLPTDKLAEAKITHISSDNGTLSINISVGTPQIKVDGSFMSLASSDIQLWSVKDLLKTPRDAHNVNQFTFSCAKCGHQIVDSTKEKFADMPSEFWHELMDFWHCHKPHEDHHNDNSKHYGKLVPRPGNVYIGASYLLMLGSTGDCPECGVSLGDIDDGCVKLHKWNLKLCYGNKSETYPPFAFAYYSLLDKINSSGSRKFLVKNGDSSFLLWVANLGLSVTTSEASRSNSLKILYRDEDAIPEADVLELPDPVYDSLRYQLSFVNSKLPLHSRSIEMTEGDKKISYEISYLDPGH